MDDTKKISSFQLGILTFFLAKASFFPIASSMILKSSRHNFWISIILGVIVGFIPLMLFIFINKHDENKNPVIQSSAYLCGIHILAILLMLFSSPFKNWF